MDDIDFPEDPYRIDADTLVYIDECVMENQDISPFKEFYSFFWYELRHYGKTEYAQFIKIQAKRLFQKGKETSHILVIQSIRIIISRHRQYHK